MAAESAPGESFTPEQGLSSDAVWKVLIDREGAWVATNSGLDWLRRAAAGRSHLPHAQKHEFSVAAGRRRFRVDGEQQHAADSCRSRRNDRELPGTRQTLTFGATTTGRFGRPAQATSPLAFLGAGFSPLHYPQEKLNSAVFVPLDRNDDPWITTSGGQAYRYPVGNGPTKPK